MSEGAGRQHGERQADTARHREAPTQETSDQSAAPGFLGPGAWLPSAAGVLRLQELVGNRVVGSLLRSPTAGDPGVGTLMRSPLGPEAGMRAPFGGAVRGCSARRKARAPRRPSPRRPPVRRTAMRSCRPGDGPSVEVGQAAAGPQRRRGRRAATAHHGDVRAGDDGGASSCSRRQIRHSCPMAWSGSTRGPSSTSWRRGSPARAARPWKGRPRPRHGGTPENGTTHPLVKLGSKGPAVEELQQKLNTVPPDQVPTLLDVDGDFGSQTDKAVREFQASRTPPIAVDGDVGPITWGELDAVAGPVTVGREEFEWRERVEGREFFGTSNFTWRLLDDRLQITVNIRFTGAPDHPRVAEWRNDITTVWNEFKFVDQATNDELLLEFVVGSGAPADASVRVVVTPPGEEAGRSDAANWHTGDTDAGLAPHEFGHLIGLQDEYNRGPEAYTVVTGEQPRIGEVEAPLDASGNPVSPDAIAAEIAAAARIDPPAARAAAVRAIVDTKYNLDQGAFATRVAEAYEIANAADMQREDFVTGTGYTVVPDPAARSPTTWRRGCRACRPTRRSRCAPSSSATAPSWARCRASTHRSPSTTIPWPSATCATSSTSSRRTGQATGPSSASDRRGAARQLPPQRRARSSDDERLDVWPDGRYEARRTVGGRRIGRFAGRLEEADLADIAAKAEAAAADGDVAVPTPMDGATVSVLVAGGEARAGSNEPLVGAWGQLVPALKALLDGEALAAPIAGLELEADASRAQLRHIGSEALEVDASSVAVRAVRLDAQGRVLGRWQGRWRRRRWRMRRVRQSRPGRPQARAGSSSCPSGTGWSSPGTTGCRSG